MRRNRRGCNLYSLTAYIRAIELILVDTVAKAQADMNFYSVKVAQPGNRSRRKLITRMCLIKQPGRKIITLGHAL